MDAQLDSIRVQLNYPKSEVGKPILYRLITEFGLIPDIRRATLDIRTGGFIYLELSGPHEQLERGLAWLDEQGITYNAIGLDGAEEWAI